MINSMLDSVANEKLVLNRIKSRVDDANTLDEIKAIINELMPPPPPEPKKETIDPGIPKDWVKLPTMQYTADDFVATFNQTYSIREVDIAKQGQPQILSDIGRRYADAIGRHILDHSLFNMFMERNEIERGTLVSLQTFVPKVPMKTHFGRIERANNWERITQKWI